MAVIPAVQAGVVLILVHLARLVRPVLAGVVRLRIAARLAHLALVRLRTAAPWVVVILVEAALLATGDLQWHR